MLENVAIVCFVVCVGFSDEEAKAPVSDFCERYERQVLSPAEVEAIKRLPPNVQRRIQGNELDYLCTCQNWKHPACRSRTK